MRPAVVRHSHSETLDDTESPEEALEAGTLAFGTQNNKAGSKEQQENDTWKRPSRAAISEDGTRMLRFEICSARSIPATETEKRHVLYTLSVRQDSDTIDPQPAEIERRYTHFLKLYEDIRKEFPALLNGVSFPKKVMLGNFGTDLISHRSTGFESLLERVACESRLREAKALLHFLLGDNMKRANDLIEQKRIELAIPVLESQFKLMSKVYLDRSRPVLIALLHLVSACTLPGTLHPLAEKYAELALRRYEGVSDTDLLVPYVPLLQTCLHLWWQKGRDKTVLEERLKDLSRRGIRVEGCPTLTQALQSIEKIELT